MRYAVALLSLVTLQRLGDLIGGLRTPHACASGGIEFGRKQYPAMVALQTAWLAGLWYWGADYAADTRSYTASDTMRNAACSRHSEVLGEFGAGARPRRAADGGGRWRPLSGEIAGHGARKAPQEPRRKAPHSFFELSGDPHENRALDWATGIQAHRQA
jgi:hypothetical protein